MMKKFVAFMISLVIILSLFQVVPVSNAENLTVNGNIVVKSMSNNPFGHYTSSMKDQKGILRIATSEPSILWNPAKWAPVSSIDSTIFANLIGETPEGGVYPDLLAEVPNVNDGTIQTNSDGTVTVTYTLRKHLKWSDGKPITSHDLYFTWKMVTDPDTNFNDAQRFPLNDIISIETSDNVTAVAHWKQGTTYNEICKLFIYPSHILEPIYNSDPSTIETCSYSTNPVHAGPYKLSEWVKGDYLTVVRNPYYHGKKPSIRKIIFKFYANKNQIINAVLNNEVDIVDPAIHLSLDDMQRLREEGAENNFYLKYSPSVYWEHLTLNLEDPILKDINLRKALMYALDRQELINTIFDGKREIADSPVNPALINYDPNITRYPYNPMYAKLILINAGYTWDSSGALINPAGNKVVININAPTGYVERQQEIEFMAQSWWTNLGVTVNYVPMNWQPMIDSWYAGTFQASLFAWGSDPLSMCYYTLYNSSQIPTNENGMNGQNFTRISDPELDYWTDKCHKSFNLQTKIEMSHKVQEIVTDKLPELYLNYHTIPFVYRKNIYGIHMPIYGSVPLTWNITEWHFGRP